MHRYANLNRTASRIASTLFLAAALGAPLAASASPALAASHARRASSASCHHRHAGHCARVTHHAHRRVRRTGRPSAPLNTGPCANANLVPTSNNLPVIDTATLCLVNRQRALNGEQPLRDNAALDAAALHHSQDMVAADYYDHTSPTGETPLDRIQASGYLPAGDGYELGENIDVGGYSLATPAAIVTAWMNSTDHRANILNADFRDSGLGVVAAVPVMITPEQVGATYTQDFGVLQSPSGASS